MWASLTVKGLDMCPASVSSESLWSMISGYRLVVLRFHGRNVEVKVGGFLMGELCMMS